MSRPRYGWWNYVKYIIRRYPALKEEYAGMHEQSVTPNMSGMPCSGNASRGTEDIAIRELPPVKQREYEAVKKAIEATERMTASLDRLKIIDLVFWKRSHTLDGAALAVPCSYMTARRYHSEFIMLVASFYGLLDKKDELKKPD